MKLTDWLKAHRLMAEIVFWIVVAAAVAGGAVVWRSLASRPHAAHQEAATYYCPMHPTYTSGRPGDCPICNMKLVKRELTPTATDQGQGARDTRHGAKDICYLHNCPMVQQGKPCPMLVVAKEGESVTCPICGTHVADAGGRLRKVLYWTDPMIPGYKSDKPGKSPMGMDLVPVYEEAVPGAGASSVEGYAPVLVSPQKRQLIGVTSASVQRRRLTKTVRAVGTVAYDPELYQAQAEFVKTVNALKDAELSGHPEVAAQANRLVEAARVRLRHLGLSEELIREIAMWDAPERGLLFTQPGEPVWIYADVYEYELLLIRVGQVAVIEAEALPGETLRGTVRAIDPLVNRTTRTTRVRLRVDDPQARLKPAMYVHVSFVIDLGEVLAIPDTAVFDTGTRQLVFVDKGEGLFEPRQVTLGAKAEGWYELRRGVEEGERVVTSGNFLIDSESRLKAALEGASAGGGHQHGP